MTTDSSVKLEDIQVGMLIRGLEGQDVCQVIAVVPAGPDALTVYYKNEANTPRELLLSRIDESRLQKVEKSADTKLTFSADGAKFKLALEAQRIRLAHLFDPMMAVHTSNVEPLPHQISAVYESMLPRQPLRYVLADDPGAGKTIMAGLLISELIMRADTRRILIVTPGSLSDQWQEEMQEKFGLHFQIFSREKQEQSPSGNFFEDADHVIARLDQLARNEDFIQKLRSTDWDLIIVDEAHKLSAHYFGGDLEKSLRYKLGEVLGQITRHFLLMTATPHNGKDEDFQLFMCLLDSDRFYGKSRDGARKVDVSDMMRRMVKEELLKFDGTKLFPERRAYTANYELSEPERDLYDAVTTYVREEMNNADSRFTDKKRRGTVGFALTQLQRRLASSPEAIYQSLKRRKKRLETKMQELEAVKRGQLRSEILSKYERDIPEDLDEIQDELNAEQWEEYAEEITDQATAAQTVEELAAEIVILADLERQAGEVVRSKEDRKWNELRRILTDTPEMKNGDNSFRKVLIFTEHRDTLNYLVDRISDLLGNPEAVATIHGGTSRDMRKQVQVQFRNHPEVRILIATDAAGEGVNLQNANLMVNYDLPWNPNRIEQRFGRIHRIGQTEVCHLWNMVAMGTREGEVFQKLFEKLEVQRKALGGRVFDVLGEAFENKSLKDLLIEAIRYGELEETRRRQREVIDGALDINHLNEIIRRNALVDQHLGIEHLFKIRDEMDRAEARKLQPHFIKRFFDEAFAYLGGETRDRESGRWEIRNVPARIREHDRQFGESRLPVARAYERICFEKENMRAEGKPMADLIHPGHPLMGAITSLMLELNRASLREGAVLVDPSDDGLEPNIVFMLEHAVKESAGDQRTVSQRLQFVTINKNLEAKSAGWAPHIDYRPISEAELARISDILNEGWVKQDLESLALSHAASKLAPEHYQEVKARIEERAEKTLNAVHERLIREINFWSDKYEKLKEDVAAGKQPRMQPENARRRIDEISARLEQRQREIEQMRNVISASPQVKGAALVIPQGLLEKLSGTTNYCADAAARRRIELAAMECVRKAEEALGHTVIDVSGDNCGWDLTARQKPIDGRLPDDRHIEVKGRAKGQDTITVTANEVIMGRNQGKKLFLAIVFVDGDKCDGPYYVNEPYEHDISNDVVNLNLSIPKLLKRAMHPSYTVMR